jgi:peptidoglycan/LPS O-acetylase OafA/YrhL
MPVLENILKRSNNNFDLIRLIAALFVIFSHSFIIFKGAYSEPVDTIVHETAGTLAVYIFFFLSGIFITGSFVGKNHTAFILQRVFRIWPALIFCTLLTVFLPGLLLTTLPAKAYLTDINTWKFLFSNIILYNVNSHRLPGLFLSNHFGSAVNGSLWTLPYEVGCYCLVFLFGIAGGMRHRLVLIAILLIVLILIITRKGEYAGFLTMPIRLFFIAGSLTYLYREALPVDYRLGLIMIVGCWLSYNTGLFYPVFYLTLIYNTFVLGSSNLFKSLKLPGDYSYGIYIFGFPVQQTINCLYPEIGPYNSLILVIPIVLVCAIVSWHLIEYPSIKYARSRGKKQMNPG